MKKHLMKHQSDKAVEWKIKELIYSTLNDILDNHQAFLLNLKNKYNKANFNENALKHFREIEEFKIKFKRIYLEEIY